MASSAIMARIFSTSGRDDAVPSPHASQKLRISCSCRWPIFASRNYLIAALALEIGSDNRNHGSGAAHAAIDTHEGAIDIARLVGREINGHLRSEERRVGKEW